MSHWASFSAGAASGVYSPGDVSEPAVTRLLEAAMAAPSAMTKDPWRFVVVRDKQTLAKLAALHPGAAMLSVRRHGHRGVR